MNVIYICKVSGFQASGNQIDIPKKVATDFFNVPMDNIEKSKNTGINICHISDVRSFEIIEIQPATNLRWSTKLNKFLSEKGESLSEGDLLVFEKLGRSYCVYAIPTIEKTYDALSYFFEDGEKHSLITTNIPIISFDKNQPLQQIFFGAPGTSKSTRIKKLVGEMEQHRVTFHPDTDYASFVGCYKPTQEEESDAITYKFVAQPFIKAYVSAWKKLYDADETHKEVFLVIEEINRGNCAQIFGDLFQLLDRDSNGYSDYTIEPDSDLSRHLKEEFSDSEITHKGIKEGSVMMLPPNLYIWATMNTSDQSLFPIDSAFKRRWDWKYTPIKNAQKGHMIQLKDRQYDWWEFLEAVNKRIEKVTESEDKQMGYWFAKPENGVAISAEKFVSKVVFYLWNDVFKDYGHDANSPFVIKQDDGKKLELRFKSFFDEDGEVDEDVLIQFFWGLKLETKSAVTPSKQEETSVSDVLMNEEVTESSENAESAPYDADTDNSEVIVSETDPEDDDTLPEATSIDDFFN